MQLKRYIKIKLHEVKHSSTGGTLSPNTSCSTILPVLTVLPIHQPALSLSAVHWCFPVAALSHRLQILGNC